MKFRRRKTGQLPVSFFAFQDIITALAGVILILVLLTLYQKSRAVPAPAEGENNIPQWQYQALQQKIAASKSRLDSTHRELDDLRKSFDAERTQQERLRRRRELTAALPEMDKLIQQRRQDLNKLQKQHDELQQQLAKYSGNNLAQLRKKFAQEFNAAETYQIKSAAGKKVLLLELARKKWQFSADGKKLSFAPTCAMQLVIEELKKFPPDKVHLVIAVRPSAGTFAEGAKSHLQQNFPAMEITAEPLMSENFGALTL